MQEQTVYAPSILDNLMPSLNWLAVDTPLVRLFNSPAWQIIKHRFPTEPDLALLERILNEYAAELEGIEVEVRFDK